MSLNEMNCSAANLFCSTLNAPYATNLARSPDVITLHDRQGDVASVELPDQVDQLLHVSSPSNSRLGPCRLNTAFLSLPGTMGHVKGGVPPFRYNSDLASQAIDPAPAHGVLSRFPLRHHLSGRRFLGANLFTGTVLRSYPRARTGVRLAWCLLFPQTWRQETSASGPLLGTPTVPPSPLWAK